jgi:hypothetical protein
MRVGDRRGLRCERESFGSERYARATEALASERISTITVMAEPPFDERESARV